MIDAIAFVYVAISAVVFCAVVFVNLHSHNENNSPFLEGMIIASSWPIVLTVIVVILIKDLISCQISVPLSEISPSKEPDDGLEMCMACYGDEPGFCGLCGTAGRTTQEMNSSYIKFKTVGVARPLQKEKEAEFIPSWEKKI